MDKKKNVGIVFGLSKKYLFAVACVIQDLKILSSDWIDDIVIIHNGISENQQKILNSIFPCRFITYNFPFKNRSSFNKSTLNYFSEMVFSKFECFKLLNEYKNVIWLDYDIIINKDFKELISPTKSGIVMMKSGHMVVDQLHSPVDDYLMNKEGVSTGTFVLQDNIKNYNDIYNFCYDSTSKYAEYLKFPEQAIFDFAIQAFDLDVCFIDKNIYCVNPYDAVNISRAKIIHSWGPSKFWNEVSNSHWNKNYSNWINIGGRGYNKFFYNIVKTVKKIFRKIGIYQSLKEFLLIIKK